MSLRRKPPQDSLDMLLDTMCNAFGGIILIAVMVALLARQAPGLAGKEAQDTREMVQRRIARAESEVESLKASLAAMNTKASDPALAERMRLAQERAQLQVRLETVRADFAKEEAARRQDAASDPAERLAQLRAQLAGASTHRTKAGNSLAAVTEDLNRMRQRIELILKQLTQATEQSVQGLRLPREHETGKRVFNIIVQHGQLFPLQTTSLERNTSSISWRERTASFTSTPIPGRGLDPVRNSEEFSQFLARLSRERYFLAFYVFEDSFATFNAAKKIAVVNRFDYGWEPQRNEDAPLSWGSTGTTPRAQ